MLLREVLMSKYYPNNWQAWKDFDENDILPPTFDEFMDWKIGGWEIPSSIFCIIRTERRDDGQVSEFVYSKRKNAEDKIQQLFIQDEHNITLVKSDTVQQWTKP